MDGAWEDGRQAATSVRRHSSAMGRELLMMSRGQPSTGRLAVQNKKWFAKTREPLRSSPVVKN
jgi:hypothetical protein